MLGCATSYDSEWFDDESKFGFVLSEPQPLDTPIPCKGSQRIFKFTPPDDA